MRATVRSSTAPLTSVSVTTTPTVASDASAPFPAGQVDVAHPHARRDPSASIHALLDRLEAAARPTPPRARDNLQETLASLRQMAAGA